MFSGINVLAHAYKVNDPNVGFQWPKLFTLRALSSPSMSSNMIAPVLPEGAGYGVVVGIGVSSLDITYARS